MQHLGGLDHVVMLVRDLDMAERQIRRLGFNPTPRGVHSPQMGTANATIMFDDHTYFEVLAPISETELNADTRESVAEREGAHGLAFKTDDARAAASEFEKIGIAGTEAVDFARDVELAEGTREAKFTIARVTRESTPGAWAFVCQQHTPEVVWRPDYLAQPNTAFGVKEVIGVTEDLAVIETTYSRLFGDRLQLKSDTIIVASGQARLRFVLPSTFEKEFGDANGTPPMIGALSFRVRSLSDATEVLDQNKVSFEHRDDRIIVNAAQGCGSVMSFEEDD